MTTTVDGTDGEPIDVLRPPLTFSDTPASVRRGVPAAGAHTREVLAEIGYDADEVDELIAAGAAATEAKPR
jgi:crotonobetainyl-CoA:carnitine CoA-transferase CaiB-like acyl-CoA transferase